MEADTVTVERAGLTAAFEAMMNLPLLDSIFYRLQAQGGVSGSEAAALEWAFNAAMEKKDAVLAAAGLPADFFGPAEEEPEPEPQPEARQPTKRDTKPQFT